MRPLLISLLALAFLLGSAPAGKLAGAEQPDAKTLKHFETHIRPLLAANCLKCHGEEKQQGGLRLDRPGDLFAGGDSGPAIVPGKPDESLLMEAVRYESYEMPPDGQLKEAQIAALAEWIAAGAPWPDFDPADLARRAQADKFSAEDRGFWSFQPLQRPEVPEVEDRGWSRNPIDKFIVRKLHEHGLEPAEEADRRTLLRRAYFDLTGLPPTPEQAEEFLRDDSPQAYEHLIDRLLDSPEYGERWARHWLDLVRYAESDGFRQDAFRPHAWRYRDYVIDSLNADKPYSQFVTEQLAGDETAPGDPNALVATGYLRHWIYEYNQRDVRTQWTDILNDVTDTTGDVFLAMGFSCARCHDHKFDPILRNDYYRLQAFFTPILPRDDVPAATLEQRQQHAAQHAQWLAATAEIRAEIATIEHQPAKNARERAIVKFPPDIEAMLRKPLAQREPLEVQLTDLAYNQVELEVAKIDDKISKEKKPRYDELQAKLAEFDHLKPEPLPPAMTASDVGPTAPATAIPGSRSGQVIEPGYLTMLDPTSAAVEPLPNSTGRRTALARWITRHDNPLTWRVMVNRIWQQHFGRGIVSSASDFGRLGSRPTHPELLDYLATEFLARGESMKEMHRLIMTSATYRQSALRVTGEKEDMVDPTAELLWRMTPRRLDAEQVRDSLLAVSGRLDDKRGGPSADPDSSRRSIYCKIIRNSPDPLLKEFDAAPGFASTSRRNVTITPTQSLLLINSQTMLSYAVDFSKRIREVGASPEARIRRAYLLAYAREPDAEEIELAERFIAGQAEAEADEAEEPPGPKSATLAERFGSGVITPTDGDTRRLALPDNAALPKGDFTLEAVIELDSFYEDSTVRTIASWWDSDTKHPGWSVGLTSTKSRYKPGNLILQLVGNTDAGESSYEVIPSDIHLERKRPYYIAVSVKLSDTRPSGVTFSVRDLSEADAPLRTAQVAHTVVSGYANGGKFLLGGRHGASRHLWHGSLDEVRLSREALAAEQLLVESGEREAEPAEGSGERGEGSQEPTAAEVPERKLEVSKIVGHWQFNRAEKLLADSSPHARELVFDDQRTSTVSHSEAAWVDFCHVLLNSNEFLYVD